jgi:DNA repair photolyase
MFYGWYMSDRLFEIARRRFDTPEFRGIEFIEVEAKSVINHVPGGAMPFDWTINPYRGCTHACVYCFARSTHTYLDMDAGRDFETKIVVKVNAPDVLRRELAAPRWNADHIAMGTATDPYQRAEGRYGLMPRIIEALTERRNPFSILTKGTLILRDLDLLVEARRTADVSTAFSIGTLDEDAWRRTEPGTPHPRRRLEAVAALNDAGVPCSVLVAPILPGITDRPAQLREIVAAAIDAGATQVSPILLHLRPGIREQYLPWLEEHYPELLTRYWRCTGGPTRPRRRERSLGRESPASSGTSAASDRAGTRPRRLASAEDDRPGRRTPGRRPHSCACSDQRAQCVPLPGSSGGRLIIRSIAGPPVRRNRTTITAVKAMNAISRNVV